MLLADASTARFGIAVGSRIPICAAANFRLRRLPFRAKGDFFLPSGRVDFPIPRPLELREIAPIVEDFAQATRNARAAGFDGVELHGANGYLQDQFLQDASNRRNDAYGGRIENRARLMIETAEAMIGAWSPERIGVRLSPSGRSLYGADDSNKLETFGYVVRALDALASVIFTSQSRMRRCLRRVGCRSRTSLRRFGR